jgi:hypothetical protein
MEAVSSFEAWPVGDPAAEAAALRAVHPARWTPMGDTLVMVDLTEQMVMSAPFGGAGRVEVTIVRASSLVDDRGFKTSQVTANFRVMSARWQPLKYFRLVE